MGAVVTRSRIPEGFALHPEARPRLFELVGECARDKTARHAYVRLPRPYNGNDDRVLIKAVYSKKTQRGRTEECVLLTPATTQDEVDMIAWDLRRKAAEGTNDEFDRGAGEARTE